MRCMTEMVSFVVIVALVACGSGDEIIPSDGQSDAPSVIQTVETSPEPVPAPDPFANPRATVTAFFGEHDPPYKRLYIQHLQTALSDSELSPYIYMSGWDQVAGQLTYGVLTENVRSAIEHRAESIGIPSSMLSVEVRGQFTANYPPVNAHSADFHIALDLDDLPTLSAPIRFAVELTNTGTESAEVILGAPPVDIVVLSSDGRQLWRYQWPIRPLSASPVTILPGQSQTFPVEWDGRNDDGDLVGLGEYLVRGFTDLSVRDESIDLATTAIPFTLITAP